MRYSLIRRVTAAAAAAALLASLTACGGTSTSSDASTAEGGDTVTVGLLHSLTGSMAISETSVRDAELLAISEINEAGGVNGAQIEYIEEDGASEPSTFATKAEKLIDSDSVSTIFGCWTSSSRKAVKPIVEDYNALLWYPVQYEGMESSPNIVYTGAAPNQQIVPAIEYLLDQGYEYTIPEEAKYFVSIGVLPASVFDTTQMTEDTDYEVNYDITDKGYLRIWATAAQLNTLVKYVRHHHADHPTEPVKAKVPGE